jgi:hypothetical protein
VGGATSAVLIGLLSKLEVAETYVAKDVLDVVVLESVVTLGDEVVVVSISVDEDDSDVVELDAVAKGLVEDESTSVVPEVVPDEEEDGEEEIIEVVTKVDELAEDDTVLVDESVTSDTMVALVLLKLEVVETTIEIELDMMVLTSKLVTKARELEPEGMVLEVDNEVLEIIDESVTGRKTLELDALLRLDLVEMINEFEIGYNTLERLLELDIRLVTILSELVDTSGLVIEDGLVNTEETVGLKSCV